MRPANVAASSGGRHLVNFQQKRKQKKYVILLLRLIEIELSSQHNLQFWQDTCFIRSPFKIQDERNHHEHLNMCEFCVCDIIILKIIADAFLLHRCLQM